MTRFLFVVTAGLLACNQTPTARAAAVALAPTGESGKNYKLDVDAPDSAKVGQKGTWKITLTPGSGFHINQEFPFEIAVTAGDVKTKEKLAKPDAKTFSEKEARFEAEFVPTSSGKKEVLFKVKFAVCTDKDCIPKTETLAWHFTAQ